MHTQRCLKPCWKWRWASGTLPSTCNRDKERRCQITCKQRSISSLSGWRRIGSQRVRIGVTDFFQQHNGDVAFANVKAAGVNLHAEDELAEMETMKVTVDLPSPVAGIIVAVNKALEITPEVVNQDPYEKGWLGVIEVNDWEADRAKLLDAPAYLAVMYAQAEEELKS